MIPFITVAHRDDKGQSHLTLMEDIQDQKVSVTVPYGGEFFVKSRSSLVKI